MDGDVRALACFAKTEAWEEAWEEPGEAGLELHSVDPVGKRPNGVLKRVPEVSENNPGGFSGLLPALKRVSERRAQIPWVGLVPRSVGEEQG